MDALTLRQRFLEFFARQRHALIGAAPLAPENDPSVLFTTAGMHPLVPYLLGMPHPAGRRLANYQVCLRTDDIAEVGDLTHLTLFEMLGNWSLGDYDRAEAIELNYYLLTEIFGHDPTRLHVTSFAGDAAAPRDDLAAATWRGLGIPPERIHFLPKSDNWWGPVGASGPCGPDSEVFVDLEPGGPPGANPASHPARFCEIANNVFMIYDQQTDGRLTLLPLPCVDVGIGLERNLMVLQQVDSVFETDLFAPLMAAIQRRAAASDSFAERVIADHLRAAMFALAEGIAPGNSDRPYVVRRLIRRAARYGRTLGIDQPFLAELACTAIAALQAFYPELAIAEARITAGLDDEERRFQRTLARGERHFAGAAEQCRAAGAHILPGAVAFRLYDTYGFPIELTAEMAARQGLAVDMPGFEQAFIAHQELSRQGAQGRFAGGLTERNPATIRLHTATHLLQAALRHVLGEHIVQRGSNITAERLRFDFSHPERLQSQQLLAVETLVNQQIARDLGVTRHEMSLAEARAAGALGVFDERYAERVAVYRIGDVSLEICGGPHVARTGEIGRFRIVKEEAVSAGVRRIRAVVDPSSA